MLQKLASLSLLLLVATAVQADGSDYQKNVVEEGYGGERHHPTFGGHRGFHNDQRHAGPLDDYVDGRSGSRNDYSEGKQGPSQNHYVSPDNNSASYLVRRSYAEINNNVTPPPRPDAFTDLNVNDRTEENTQYERNRNRDLSRTDRRGRHEREHSNDQTTFTRTDIHNHSLGFEGPRGDRPFRDFESPSDQPPRNHHPEGATPFEGRPIPRGDEYDNGPTGEFPNNDLHYPTQPDVGARPVSMRRPYPGSHGPTGGLPDRGERHHGQPRFGPGHPRHGHYPIFRHPFGGLPDHFERPRHHGPQRPIGHRPSHYGNYPERSGALPFREDHHDRPEEYESVCVCEEVEVDHRPRPSGALPEHIEKPPPASYGGHPVGALPVTIVQPPSPAPAVLPAADSAYPTQPTGYQ